MRGLLLGVVSVVLSALGAVACTTSNPAYDGTGTSSEPQQGTTALATAAEGGTSAAHGESSGEPTCELHDPRPLLLELSGDLVPPLECDGGSVVLSIPPLPEGRNQYETQNTVIHCESPSCDGCDMDARELRIRVAQDLVFGDGAFANCGTVELWSRMNRSTQACEWAGVALYEQGDLRPYFIASRTREFWIHDVPFRLELVEGDACAQEQPCGDDLPAPGRYSLDVLGQDTVEVQPEPQPLTVMFGGAGMSSTYLFHDRMSSVTPDCQLELAWTAQLQE